jgi:flagellar basal-body rod modification protein FlgD
MPIDPTTAATTTSSTSGASGASRGATAGTLGKDDFLKLLIGQMQNQDPLNPTDGAEYMAQMTQFSILEQITNLGSTTSAAASNQYDAQAVGLIGKTVTYLAGRDLEPTTGVVESVAFTNHGPELTVGGRGGVLPVSITKVDGAPVGNAPAPDPSSGSGAAA